MGSTCGRLSERRTLKKPLEVYDWEGRFLVGHAEVEVRKEGRVAAYEVRLRDGVVIEYPIEQLREVKGRLMLMPTWYVVAEQLISRLQREPSKEAINEARRVAAVLNDILTALEGERERQRELVLAKIADYSLGDISEDDYQSFVARLQEERRRVNERMQIIRDLIDRLNMQLVAAKLGEKFEE